MDCTKYLRPISCSRLSLALLWLFATVSNGFELGTGLAGIEDGDDRIRPAAVLHGAAQNGYGSRLYVYGRDYGPVRERNFVLSMSKRFDIASKTWQGILGIAGLADMTSIDFPENPEDNMTYTSTNIGMVFGIHWNLYESKRIQLKATWDGHVFPAGTGFIFLANARKSALGLTASTLF